MVLNFCINERIRISNYWIYQEQSNTSLLTFFIIKNYFSDYFNIFFLFFFPAAFFWLKSVQMITIYFVLFISYIL